MRVLREARSEAGITVIEVMVAAVILMVGLLGTLTLMNGANAITSRDNQRVTATSIARELTEGSRSVDYDDLTASRMSAALQALGTLGSGTPWIITRRNTKYTVTPDACVWDDPADGIAYTTTGVSFCSNEPAADTTKAADNNGDDFRRVTFTVSWRDSKYRLNAIKQVAMVPNPSGGLGPRIIALTPVTNPVTTGTQAQVAVDTTTTATTVHWTTDDGVSQGDVGTWTTGTGKLTFTINWPLGTAGATGSVYDGVYQVYAQAFDARNVPGDSKVTTVTLNRIAPIAPTGLLGGHDTRIGDVLDFDWSLNPERDIVGYRLYYAGSDNAVGGTGTAADTQICATDDKTATCQVSPATITGQGSFFLRALDKDTTGAIRTGSPSAVFQVAAPGSRPSAPSCPCTATLNNGQPTLAWQAPSSGSVLFYRVYRDGTAYSNRYGRVGGSTPNWSESSSTGTHEYYVTAVDANYNESDPLDVGGI